MKYNSFGNAGNAAWGRFSGLYYYRKQIGYAAIGLGVFYVANLEQAPVSHRLRFMIVPRWLETRIGERTYRQTMLQFGNNCLPDYDPKVLKIKSVMDRIIKVADLPADVQWKLHVIRGPFPPNAFVIPGGKVFVFESILPICQDDDGLATILSHETAHQVCRHTSENLSKAPFKLLISGLLYAVTGSAQLDDLMMSLTLELPSSRAMESEADTVGMQMMAKACFHPEGAIGLWQRMVQMEKEQGSNLPEWMSSHPASQRRIDNIKKLLPEVEQIRNQNCTHLESFWNNFA